MDAEEVEVISELRAIQFTIDKIVMSLKTLEEMTGPGGKLFTAQEEFAQVSEFVKLVRAGF